MVYFHDMIERNLTTRILQSLRDTPVVYLQGARQTGKSTLAQLIAKNYHPAQYLSLDTMAVLSAAESDPEGFIAGLRHAVVLDEVQRAPSLALAIKSAVDADRQPGRFFLTGSAVRWPCHGWRKRLSAGSNCIPSGHSPQGRFSVAGKASWTGFSLPLSSLKRRRARRKPMFSTGFCWADIRKPLPARARTAAMPGSIPTSRPSSRDVRDLANIEKIAEIPRLLALLASRLAELVNYADLSRSLAIPQSTLKRYFALLEATFLVRLLPAWFANIGKRLTKSPKLLISDTGLAAYLLDLNLQRLQGDRGLLGHLLENFVAMELIKQTGWATTRVKPYHFRTESGQEVDLVLEDAAGQIVGIEVKAAVSLDAHDLRGLKTLAELSGEPVPARNRILPGRGGRALWQGPLGRARLHGVEVDWFLARLHVEELDRLVAARQGQQLAVRAESPGNEIVGLRVERGGVGAGGQVPRLDLAGDPERYHHAAVGSECEGGHAARRVSGKRHGYLAEAKSQSRIVSRERLPAAARVLPSGLERCLDRFALRIPSAMTVLLPLLTSQVF